MSEPTTKQYFLAESETARSELEKMHPQQAIVRFYRRQDAAIATATARATEKPACKAGCSYCCHFKVEALAVEVLAIHQYVTTTFSADQIKAVVAQAERNVAEASSLTYIEQLETNQRCPFLVDDRCSVYPVRPATCRGSHAVDVETCKHTYKNPTQARFDIQCSYIPQVKEATDGTRMGFLAALQFLKLDIRAYDLNSAFLEAMNTPSAAKRLKNGKRVFLHTKSVEPPDDATFARHFEKVKPV